MELDCARLVGEELVLRERLGNWWYCAPEGLPMHPCHPLPTGDWGVWRWVFELRFNLGSQPG